jgi:UDP-GlcNAc:undecaprenyl-phosphate GlcNAc-1-phosphate transferase
LKLIVQTNNYGWIAFLVIYGVDAVCTISYRLLNKENIFKPHRSHLYQYLANELRKSHLVVSSVYGILQLSINVFVIYYMPSPTLFQVVLLIGVVSLIYLIIRESVSVRIGKRGLMSYWSK